MANGYKNSLLGLILSLMLAACGGGGGGGSEAPSVSAPQSSTTEMVLNKQYSVSTGDEIKKSVADSRIRIEQDTKDNATYVTLLSGAAQLTRAAQ